MRLKLAIIGLLFASSCVMAQPLTPALTDAMDRLAREDTRRREEAERNKRDDKPQVVIPDALPDDNANGKKETCFTIKTIEITGYEALGSLPQNIKENEGKCVSVTAIARLLTQLNRYYQDRAYTTSRAYVPEQNLKSGMLKITVVPGRIEDFAYKPDDKTKNDKTKKVKPKDVALTTAFPAKPNDLLNLRDLEQGLDNLNSLPSNDAKFELIPGSKPGESIVQVALNEKKRWRASLTTDNTGQETTGVYKTKLDVGFDNLAGLNDLFTIGFGKDIDREFRNRKSYDGSIGWSAPFGNWSFNLASGFQTFMFDIPGINETYRSFGYSGRVTAGLEYMLYRDQNGKYYAFSDITRKAARNFNSGYEILTQRRDLTVQTIGLRGKNYFGKNVLEWKAAMKIGLKLFGAEHPFNSPSSHQFNAYSFNGSWRQPFDGDKSLWKSTVTGQYSADLLPGSEQFSLGGRYDVRGFQEDTLFGNSGVYWRNEFERQLIKTKISEREVTITGIAGFDVGGIKIPQGMVWSTPILAGASLGSRFQVGQGFTFDLTYARALKRPKEFTHSPEKLYFSLTLAL
jgi:hemolysin activation/secretion protein